MWNGPCSPVLQVVCVLGELCLSPAAVAAARPTLPRHGASQQTALGPPPPARPAARHVPCAWHRVVAWGHFLRPHRGCGTTGTWAAAQDPDLVASASSKMVSAQVPLHRRVPKPCIFTDRVKTIHCRKKEREGEATKERRKERGEKGEEKLGKEICKPPSHCHWGLFPPRFLSRACVACSVFFNTVVSAV